LSDDLKFRDLSKRHPGVTDAISAYFYEAAQVCLGRHHAPPQYIELQDGSREIKCTAQWTPADARTRRSWANTIDATRDGAYGIALAAMELTRGLVAVRRAETGTGSDYYLGSPGDLQEDLENSLRLEVSGTDEGDGNIIRSRLRQKISQARAGNDNLPAVAAVVAFLALKIVASDV
jgi:hypothetical protein